MARSRRFWQLFPIFWLSFLIYPIMGLYQRPQAVWPQVVFWALLIGFLAIYFRTFMANRGEERWAFVGWAYALLTYGLTYPIVGGTATAFLIYGGSLIGFQSRASVALWLAFLNTLFLAVPFWQGKADLSDLSWLLPNALFTMVAAYANHASYTQGIMRVKLEQTQIEKEKLAADAERERIARDLHDLLGHTLSVIVLKSELAAKLAEKNPAKAVQEIKEVEQISREALQEVRAAVRGYRGSGFGAELARAKVALDAAGVKLTVTDALPDLPPLPEASAAMLLREAITNVVRHAKAKEVRVSLRKETQGFRLSIEDDGIGGDAPEGTGLTGMRERLQSIGGSLERDGRNGTRLTAFLPNEEPPKGEPGRVTA